MAFADVATRHDAPTEAPPERPPLPTPVPNAPGRRLGSPVYLLLALVSAATVGLDALPALLRAVAPSVFLLAVPGAAAMSRVRRLSWTSWLFLSIVLSLAIDALAAELTLAVHWWHPALLTSALALACLPPLLMRAFGDPRLTAGTDGMLNPPPARMDQGWWPHALILLLALGCWLFSVAQLDPARATDLGLFGVLSPLYWCGLGYLFIGFWWSILQRRRLVPALYLLALLLMLHGTIAATGVQPRYTYFYKHISVAEYIGIRGRTDRALDLYQNWPGFFAAMALMWKATGVSALRYANWAQAFFAALDALGVVFIARALTRDLRQVWVAAWIYVLADWVGQNYLSPQAFGFVLVLATVGLVLHAIPARRHGRPAQADSRRQLDRTARRLSEILRLPPAADPPIADDANTIGRRTAIAFFIVLVAAVAISHQLSPVLLTVDLAALAVIRRCPRWLPIAALALTVTWFALGDTYVLAHFRLFNTDPFQNASGAALANPGSSAHQLVAKAAKVLSIGVWVAAALSAWRLLRHGSRQSIAAALLLAPFSLVLVQAYGGEAVYRVYLFSLPAAACLISFALLGPRPLRQPTRLVSAILLVSMIPLFIVAYFGLERSDYVSKGDVAAALWFRDNAPRGSALNSVAGNFPSELSDHYDWYFLSTGTWGSNVVSQPQFTGRVLTAGDIPPVVAYLRSLGATRTFVLLSPREEAYAEAFGVSPPGAVAHFSELLMSSPQFTVVFRSGDSAVLELNQ